MCVWCGAQKLLPLFPVYGVWCLASHSTWLSPLGDRGTGKALCLGCGIQMVLGPGKAIIQVVKAQRKLFVCDALVLSGLGWACALSRNYLTVQLYVFLSVFLFVFSSFLSCAFTSDA